jgi:hypothetical protein
MDRASRWFFCFLSGSLSPSARNGPCSRNCCARRPGSGRGFSALDSADRVCTRQWVVERRITTVWLGIRSIFVLFDCRHDILPCTFLAYPQMFLLYNAKRCNIVGLPLSVTRLRRIYFQDLDLKDRVAGKLITWIGRHDTMAGWVVLDC